MSEKRRAMRIKKEEVQTSSLNEHLAVVSQRLSPLVDTSSIQGFGLRLHGNILGIENHAYQTNRVTNEEQKKNMQKTLKEEICKLGAMVYNKIASEPLPNTSDFYYVNVGGKRKRKTRRRMRGKRKGKSRRKRKR